MHNLLDPDLLQMLASELGMGVLIMAWIELRHLHRELAECRIHLKEKWRIYTMVTAALDEGAKSIIITSTRKDLH